MPKPVLDALAKVRCACARQCSASFGGEGDIYPVAATYRLSAGQSSTDFHAISKAAGSFGRFRPRDIGGQDSSCVRRPRRSGIAPELAVARPWRAGLAVPMMREGNRVGASLQRKEP